MPQPFTPAMADSDQHAFSDQISVTTALALMSVLSQYGIW